MEIATILSQIDLGSMALPEFQRGYVWNRDQVRSLMDSLYRRHPVGGLLVWVTRTETADVRGDGPLQPGVVKLLLDGQQRVTSLYGIIRGKPPRFFDGNAAAFAGLHFHLETETFEFYGPVKMRDDPLWINVTELMTGGVGGFIDRIYSHPQLKEKSGLYVKRLSAVEGIKNIGLHIDEITGEDKSVDVVVEIFNKVNSGGTKLSKGDLALAKVCAEWPDARDEMKRRLEKWRRAGYHFKLEWLLRNINAVMTGEAMFSALRNVTPAEFKGGLERAERAVDHLLNLISGRLGLDHDRVLGSRYSFPLLARYLAQRNFRVADYREQDKLLYWYVHTFLWGRYAGSTETVLNRDLGLIEGSDGALDRLILGLRQDRGDLRVQASDFSGWSKGARFYPLLYLLTRVLKARDWDNGIPLSSQMLGKLSSLQLHHIFPKARLYRHGYARAEVNAVANFTFLTQETNLKVSSRDPAEYLEEFAAKHPGAVESHWIPMHPELWSIERYREFLAARRELLAGAANDLLDSLFNGHVPPGDVGVPVLAGGAGAREASMDAQDDERVLLECNEWIVSCGLPEGELYYEVANPEGGDPIVLDLAWPSGLQEGLTEPVALLLDEGREAEEAANRAGYRYFTDPEALKRYVRRHVLAGLIG